MARRQGFGGLANTNGARNFGGKQIVADTTTGYVYSPSTETAPSLIGTPASAGPSLTVEPVDAQPTLTYGA